MKISLVLVSMLATAGATQAQFSAAKPRVQRPTTPPVASQPPPAPLVGGSDSCTTPDVITGTGSFAFDDSTATTGSEGQSTINCIEFNQIPILNDVWFSWTAPQSGRVALTTCPSTIDTKVAVYLGTACPAPGATAAACNDDATAYTLQTKLFFDVTAGQQFLIQLGISPVVPPQAVPGAGTFSLEFLGDTCAYDDGNTEQSIGLTAGGTTAWLQSFGTIGNTTSVSAVSTAWGASIGRPFPAGGSATVAVWDDPNDDGSPNDAVLLGSATATVTNPSTDQLQTVTLSSPVTVTGIFFVGALVPHTTNQFPAPMDGDACGYRPGVAWIAGQATGTFDLNNLGANSVPPATFDSVVIQGIPQRCVLLLQASCGNASVGTPFCLGDGSATACPCGNNSPVGASSGCLSSLGTGGKLVGQGAASIAADSVVLQGTAMPNSSALYFQGTTQQSGGAGAVFGDGLRCAGGVIVRLGTNINAAGASQYPMGAQPSVSVKGGVTTPATRTYQIWYRNAAAFCTISTFNLSNGLSITWVP